MNGAAPGSSASPAERLRGVVVHLRADLDVNRQLAHGKPIYVVRDPVSFQSHALDPDEYEIFVGLDLGKPLGETFDALVERGRLADTDEDAFYAFVLSLHRAGLLNLPIADGRSLYRRHERRRRANRKAIAMKLLFLRVPVWNADAFIGRTAGVARWAFTRWAFAAWFLLMAAAGVVVFARRDDLAAPLLGMLEFQNLPALWILLIGLKVCHEFGHAYACKAFGGSVPEMGLFFIVGTPCAYVDATAAWGFPDRSKRLAVSMAGIYVESLLAAVAVFVWAATDPGAINTAAYQTAFLASVVTIGFNLNPLAKFDGYYALSDLLGVPNLRARSSEQLVSSFDHVVLGIKPTGRQHGFGMRLFLVSFGIASMIYRVSLVIGISAMIATKLFLVGIGLAALYIGMSLVGFIGKAIRHLWFSPVTADVRFRAVVASLLVLGVLPAAIVLTPITTASGAWGTIEHDGETVVRAGSPGKLVVFCVQEHDAIDAGATLARLLNSGIAGAVDITRAQLALATTERAGLLGAPAAAYAAAEARIASARLALEDAERRHAELSPATPAGGIVLYAPLAGEHGVFVRAGDTIAVVGEGDRVARLFVTEDLLASVSPEIGDAVSCRLSIRPGEELIGTISSIAPVGSREIDDDALTSGGIGVIATGPARATASAASSRPGDTGRDTTPSAAGRTYFVITVRLPSDSAAPRGATVRARFDAEREPAGIIVYRRVSRFLNNLRSG